VVIDGERPPLSLVSENGSGLDAFEAQLASPNGATVLPLTAAR
jgi:hypothetical protein